MTGEFQLIDYRRATFAEFMWEKRSLRMILNVLLFKFSSNSSLGSTDDPTTCPLAPFVVQTLPQELQSLLAKLESEFAALGFQMAQRHLIDDSLNRTTTVLVSCLHPSGVIGRMHLRLVHHSRPPAMKLFAEMVSPSSDGGFLWTLSGAPDLIAPSACRVERHVTAAPAALLALHQKRAAAASALAVRTPSALDACLEKLHKLVWDFHTARGVFRPATAAERDAARRGEALQAPKADGTVWRYPAALHEIELLQKPRSSWKSSIWLLVISLALFLFIGRGTWRWSDYLYLVPILFFHELGHYLAMRGFGYQNLKMFFIPGLGAAVTGKNYNVAGWKQVIVYLMGPLPGILVGIGLGLFALYGHRDSLLHVATLAILINGFNLIPLMPLDGGRVMHALLFSRHPILDVAFRVLAGVALIAASFKLGQSLLFLGILMLLGLPAILRLARITQEMRRAGLATPSTSAPSMPPELAEVIIQKLVTSAPTARHPRLLARNALSVYENLNARPPRWPASCVLLGVYGLALAVTIIFAGQFVTAQRRANQALMEEIAGPAPHRLPPQDPQRLAPPDFTEPLGPHISVIATLDGPRAVQSLREAWRPSLSSAAITTFGDTFAVTLAPNRARWGDEMLKTLKTAYDNVYMEDADHNSNVHLEGIALDATAAQSLVEELQEYLALAPLNPAMAAPWSVGDGITEEQYARYRTVRKSYGRILEIMHRPYASDPQVAALNAQIMVARDSQDTAAVTALLAQRDALHTKMRLADLNSLRADGTVDAEFLDLYLKLPPEPAPPLPLALVVKLGLLSKAAPTPASASLADSGQADSQGTFVELDLEVPNFTHAIPAAAHWLQARGIRQLQYQMRGPIPHPEPQSPHPQ